MENSEQTFLGVLIGGVHTYFPKEIIRGISKEADRENVNVYYFLGMQTSAFLKHVLGEHSNASYDYQFDTIYDYSKISGLDGMLINYGTIGPYLKKDDAQAFAERFHELPCVFLTEKVDMANCYSIISDNYNGMYSVVEHLITEHGCRRILFVKGPIGNTDAIERFEGYRDAMKKHGLEVRPEMIVQGDFSEFIDCEVKELLDRNPDAEAIAFANDEMAYSGCRVCIQRGLKVGEEIRITGFDNNELSRRMDPPLTTLFQDGRGMGELAVQNMMRILKGEEVSFCRYPTRLILRESCGCGREKTEQIQDEKSLEEELERLQKEVTEKQLQFVEFQRKSWLLPMLMKELNEGVSDECEFCRRILNTLTGMGVSSSYLFLLDHPVVYDGEKEWACPDNLHMASFCRNGSCYAYPLEKRPLVTKEQGIAQLTDDGRHHQYMVYLLFSGERQYGLLLCEVSVRDIPFYYVVSLQIGLALHNYELNRIEAMRRQQLCQDMERIREQNRELGMKSAYDQLTGLLNLRGFTDRAKKICTEERKQRAYLLYGDLDHLKEINDTWGHAEGNFAIKASADILKNCIRGNDMIARIGGDEFSCLIFSDGESVDVKLKNRIVQACREFNKNSGKPYYVELSIGIECFELEKYEELQLAAVKADQKLYEAKKGRRKSIRRVEETEEE